MGKLTISMAMFNSYFDITRGYLFYQNGLIPNDMTDMTRSLSSRKSPKRRREIDGHGEKGESSAIGSWEGIFLCVVNRQTSNFGAISLIFGDVRDGLVYFCYWIYHIICI